MLTLVQMLASWKTYDGFFCNLGFNSRPLPGNSGNISRIFYKKSNAKIYQDFDREDYRDRCRALRHVKQRLPTWKASQVVNSVLYFLVRTVI